jgi:four helix bundle protein
MLPFEDLDAFKACHKVTLKVHGILEPLSANDPEIAAQLWAAALRAPARIARGTAFSNRRRFALCVDRALACLSEVGYQLSMVHALSLIPEEEHRELESLRGRAVFYTTKLLMTLISGEDPGTAPPAAGT